MPGHIAMGAPGALREYMIVDTDLYSKAPANQFAAKLATGGGNYDDLQNWSYLVLDNWEAGVGKKDVEVGGFLYAEAETRFPNRLSLPNALSLVTMEDPATNPLNFGYQPGKDLLPDSAVTVGAGSSVKRIAHALNGRNSSALYVALWLDNTTTNTSVALYSSTTSGGNQIPDSQLALQTFTPNGEPGYSLYFFQFAGSFTSGSYYHVVIYPTSGAASISIPIRTTAESSEYFSTYNGSVWANYTGGAFAHGVHFLVQNPISHVSFFPATGYLYAASGAALLKKASVDTDWATVDTLPTTISSLTVVGDELWIGQGNTTDFEIMDDTETVTGSGVPGRLFVLANGYVWRAVNESVYYTADGSTWEGPFPVAWPGHQVRGMAPMGDYLYVSTDEGLYYVGYGNFVFNVCKWAGISATNGKGMINHRGALFIPTQHAIQRFDGNGMLPVGLDLGEGLPEDRVNPVTSLYSLNNWMVATVSSTSFYQKPTVWAYNDQGWHFLATLPKQTLLGGMSYDPDTRNLCIGASYGCVWQLPVNDSANFYSIDGDEIPRMPFAWLETDWFFGGLMEVQKDFESLYVTGDNISATQFVRLYWKDDASTGWELLGTVDSEREEIRWSDYSTRPNTRQIKIGVALHRQATGDPLVVRAIRAKYHPMVSDWFRWSFPILASNRQQQIGGTISSYTAAQKRTHLDGLITQVPPFILRDMDGVQYEVKVMGCQIQNMDVEWINGEMVFNSIYNMTVEQIRNDIYT